jgi:hypothetical protein
MEDVSKIDSEKQEFQSLTESEKQEFQSVTESEKQEFQCGCGVYLSSNDLIDYKSDVDCPGPPLLNKARNGIEGNILSVLIILENIHTCKYISLQIFIVGSILLLANVNICTSQISVIRLP